MCHCCYCVCVLVICSCMFILSYTSCQTLGFTRVWLPAPAVKHHGVHSWKSKVHIGLIMEIIFKLSAMVFFLDRAFFSIHSESGGVMVMKNHDENELPGPPSKPQVTDVTKNSVSLSWQPGLAGASPVSSFVIEAFRFVLSVTSKPHSLLNSLHIICIID